MILFLDFDGVLHPDEVYLDFGRPVLRAEGQLFMWAGWLTEVLAHHPDVRIVLSTSWVRELRFGRALKYLPADLQARVVGATWHSSMATDQDHRPLGRQTWWDLATRYEQVKRHVNRAGWTDWIALDDKPEGWPEADRVRLVQTDSARGLSDPAALTRLRELLNTRPLIETSTNILIHR